jgi:putative ABC transport system substrate-binding protein
MRRRELLKMGGGATVTWPIPAYAQQLSPKKVGFLSSYTAQAGSELVGCFQNGLTQAGWIEGRDIGLSVRWAEGREDRYAPLAVELTKLDLDVIACNSTPAAQALQRVTRSIPIVFMSVSEPIESGIVVSLPRPAGNITGVSNYSPAITGKLLELLRSVLPAASRVVVLRDPGNAGKRADVQELQLNASKLGVTLQITDVRSGEDIERAFAASTFVQGTAVIALTDGVTLSNRGRIAELAMQHRTVSIFQTKEFVDAGGLMSYGVNFCQHFRRAAVYVDRILRGAKPADLPVELPTTFELTVNLSTAKAIGLTVPQTVLATADQVIE